MKCLIPILFALILAAWPVMAGDEGIVVRTSPLFASANYSSKRIGQVEAGTAVSIERRVGGWKRIVLAMPALDGWVRSYQVRDAATAPALRTEESGSDSRGFLDGLASFSRKASSFFRSGSQRTSSSSATIGVRGLSEDEIKSARADFDEFGKLRLFASDAARAAKFARQGGLRAIRVPHVAGPK